MFIISTFEIADKVGKRQNKMDMHYSISD